MKIVIVYSVSFLLPLIIYFFAFFYAPSLLAEFFQNDVIRAIVILGSSIYYLFVWIFFFRSWIDYYLDVWFMTNERIVSIEQRGLFSRTIAEQKLFRIQDVNAEVHGLIATVLDYGTITIQTAGAEKVFFFKQVPRPHKVARHITQLVEWDKRERRLDR